MNFGGIGRKIFTCRCFLTASGTHTTHDRLSYPGAVDELSGTGLCGMAGADGKRVVDLSLIHQCAGRPSQNNTPCKIFSYRCNVLSFTLRVLQQFQ